MKAVKNTDNTAFMIIVYGAVKKDKRKEKTCNVMQCNGLHHTTHGTSDY
jgi:hypothetical protein